MINSINSVSQIALGTTPYKLRTTLVFFFFCLLYAIILVNLAIIQIFRHDFYINLGNKQYNVTVTQRPPRASIFDRSGTCLALNKEVLSAFMLPRQLKEPLKIKKFLAQHFPAALERLHTHPDAHFLFVKRRLTQQEQDLINKSALADINILAEPSRFYPIESMGPVIGITDIDNNGLFGMELSCNEQLAGTPTTFSLHKDARSGHFYFKRETKIAGTQGTPLTLTLDSTLQFLVTEAVQETMASYQAKEGLALVMDPTSGEILAMVNLPAFDPNAPEQIDLAKAKNKIVTEVYELGSVIKVCMALAAFDEKVVSPDELVDCENKRTTIIDGRVVNTARTTETGIVPFAVALQKSNNIGIAKIARRLDTKLYDHYRRLGFGKKTGIDFPGERDGFVNPPEKWSKQSLFSLSYGYEISGSLLQLARVFCIIANDGYDCTPHLIMNQPMPARQQIYPKTTTDTVRQILDSSARSGKVAQVPGYAVVSKTGTANMLVNGKYDPDKNCFTCAGIVSKDSYKRVIVVNIKEIAQKNMLAARIAMPLFEKIAHDMVIHEQLSHKAGAHT
jgi:cell division protein FtsI/penicillin-binding protein 2